MKSVYVVINQSKDVLLKPYSHQYLVFAEQEPLFAYLEKAGWGRGAAPALMSICLDVGMVNWYIQGDIDLKVVCLELK